MLHTMLRALQSLMMPPGLVLLFLGAGLLLSRRRPATGRALVIAGAVLLYLLSLAPVSDVLIKPLERAYAGVAAEGPAQNLDAVVVLGGGLRDLSWLGRAPEVTDLSLERVVAGMRLAQQQRCALVLVGGVGDPSKKEITEAEAMARIAASIGFPERRIVAIAEGRDTRESAAVVRTRVTGSRIGLVTSAYHLPRSVGLFREQGFDVRPEASGYLGERRSFSLFLLLPRLDSFDISCVALAEYESTVWDGMLQRFRKLR